MAIKEQNETSTGLIDSSRLMTESFVRAGADVFVGYPITPANLLYLYGNRRYPEFIAAPDEITTLQLMSGYSAAGKLPVTATSFPGFALMIESINMAYMMELPMVIVLVQRLGPATGTATCGAQGDVSMVNNFISGGYAIPVLNASSPVDCWEMPAKAMKIAVELRTPVILLTSKEEIMTLYSYDLTSLTDIQPVKRLMYEKSQTYKPYQAQENLVPEFLSVNNSSHQVRITASTHDTKGIIQNTSEEALNNTKRLHKKIIQNMKDFAFYEYDRQQGASMILVSYGISSLATLVAVDILRKEGNKVSVLTAKTLFPVPPDYLNILKEYQYICFVEENMTGQYREHLFGQFHGENIFGVNKIGKMIEPIEIVEQVKNSGFLNK